MTRDLLSDRDLDELVALAEGLPPDDQATAAAPDEVAPGATTFAGMDNRELAEYVVARLPDEELAALPEVQAAVKDPDCPVRDHRLDYEAVALGEMVEAEREEAARQAAEQENAQAAEREAALAAEREAAETQEDDQ